jgi:RNA polymerase sigma-70 factor (ECF subfamily)
MPNVYRSDAFVESLLAIQPRLYAYILTLLPNTQEAWDMLQQTNMALWHDAERFVEGTNFVAWAFRIARFMVLEHREKRSRDRLRFGDSLIDELASVASDGSNEDAEMQLAAMRQCIDQLPEGQQGLIRRRYTDGESLSTIAASIGDVPNVVANRLYRIRYSLWKCIQRRLVAEGLE